MDPFYKDLIDGPSPHKDSFDIICLNVPNPACFHGATGGTEVGTWSFMTSPVLKA